MSNPEQQTAVTSRKTIQLEAVSLGQDQGVMFALCNDGTIWFQRMGTGDSEPWEKIDEPPQPDPCGMDDPDNPFSDVNNPPESRDKIPDCNRCGNNDNVVPDYGMVSDDDNLPPEVEHDHKVPFNCLHCGREWVGSFVTSEDEP